MKYILLAKMMILCAVVQGQTIMRIHQNNGTVIQIPINTIDSITYINSNPGNLASITTLVISNITTSNATSGGNITNDGGSPITQRGICWSTVQNPTTANNTAVAGSGTGNFTANLMGLAANTTYYVRAYAINSAGTAYGNEQTFTTLPYIEPGIEFLFATLSSDQITIKSIVNNPSGQKLLAAGIIWDLKPGINVNLQTKTLDSIKDRQLESVFQTEAGKSYYVRAYITDPIGTYYTDEFLLHTEGAGTIFNANVYYDSIIDIDNNKYLTIKMGNQEWMAENLKVTRFRNGEPIQNINFGDALFMWDTLKIPAITIPDAEFLYNGYVIEDSRKICPNGWRIPTLNDWYTLINYLGGEIEAGKSLRSTFTSTFRRPSWNPLNRNATNSSGFSALPGGIFEYGTYDSPSVVGSWWGSDGYIWIAPDSPASSSSLGSGGFNRNNGSCIRCIKE